MAQGALPGFRDFYPAEFSERAYIMRVWREVARRYAFVEYDGPPLEPLDLYTKKSGDEIVGQLYNFTDKGDREVTLRPEMTPTFARMVAARANAVRKPVRWFSIPQLFRYERQQKGRLREHFQLNVDIVGEADVTADAELLAVTIDMMRTFGFTPADVRARVSDRRLLSALLTHAGVSEEQMPAAYAVIDKLEREPREALAKKLQESGVGEAIATRVFEVVKPMSMTELRAQYREVEGVAEHVARLDRYFGYLEALGAADWVQLDLSIVRGLAYYTGIVFELFDAKGDFRAICGGGRYDNLLNALGGTDLPALGFGMGDVVLGELLRARGLMPAHETTIDYWVASDGEELLPLVMATATALRRLGFAVEYALRGQSLSRQMKTASAAGATRIVILKRDALMSPRKTAVVKTLADGSEEEVEFPDWLTSIR
jgi:histidyl-tRNA synthetase